MTAVVTGPLVAENFDRRSRHGQVKKMIANAKRMLAEQRASRLLRELRGR
jgi:hypothetical protein